MIATEQVHMSADAGCLWEMKARIVDQLAGASRPKAFG